MNLKQRIQEDMKTALRAGEKGRLGVIRLILAAIKQVEVDERIEVDDGRSQAILSKMLKQRQDAMAQFKSANRQDLVDQELFESNIIQAYLPQPLTETELDQLVSEAIAAVDARSLQAMGQVMNWLKPHVLGRADMGLVSAKIKQKLT